MLCAGVVAWECGGGSVSVGRVRAENCNRWVGVNCTACTAFVTGNCSDCETIAPLGTNACACGTNFNGGTYTRANSTSACCAPSCDTSCTAQQHYASCSACVTLFEQPLTAFNVCFADCPTGYTEGTGVCTSVTSGKIISYALDRIIQPFPNEAVGGSNEAVHASALNASFKVALPYKLPQAYRH